MDIIACHMFSCATSINLTAHSVLYKLKPSHDSVCFSCSVFSLTLFSSSFLLVSFLRLSLTKANGFLLMESARSPQHLESASARGSSLSSLQERTGPQTFSPSRLLKKRLYLFFGSELLFSTGISSIFWT